MKKRLKGLVSLWLTVTIVFSLITVMAMAADPVYVTVYTGETGLEDYASYWPDASAEMLFDTALNEQTSITDTLTELSKSHVLTGWRLWGAYSGQVVPITDENNDVISPQTIGKSGTVSETFYYSIIDTGNSLVIEPLWQAKYQINPQPPLLTPPSAARSIAKPPKHGVRPRTSLTSGTK